MTTEIEIKIKATGSERVRRITAGIVTGAKRADKAVSRSSRQSAQSQQRDAQESARIQKRASRDTLRQRQRDIDAERRAFDGMTRSQIASARRRQREQSQASRTRRGGARGSFVSGALGRFAPAAMGTAAFAAIASSLSEVVQNLTNVTNAVAAATGAQDIGQRTVSAQEFEVELTRLTSEVGASRGGALDLEGQAEMAAELQAQILSVARATNQEPGQLLGALRTLQTEFGAFDFGVQNLRALALEATRSGDSLTELARFAGQTNRQFGDIDVDTLFNLSAQAGLTSSLTTGDFAENFAGISGVFRAAADPMGAADSATLVRDFVALANTVRTGTGDAATAATQTRGLLFSLANQDTQNRIALATGGVEGAGGRIAGGVQLEAFKDEQGRVDLSGFFNALSEAEGFRSLEAISAAVPNIRAAAALNTVLSRQREGGAASFTGLQGVSEAAGGALRAGGIRRILGTGQARQKAVSIQGQIEGIGGAEERGGRAFVASRAQESFRGQGMFGEFVSGFDSLFNVLGAVASTEAGEGAIRGLTAINETGVSTRFGATQVATSALGPIGSGVGGLLLGLEAVGPVLDSILTARTEQRAGVKQTAAGKSAPARTTMDPSTINAIGTSVRTGAEAGIRAVLGGNDGNRGSGGPVAREANP